MKKWLWISTVCLFILLVSGCSGNNVDNENKTEDNQAENDQTENESKSNTELGDYKVDISGEIIEKEEKFTVEGESNLLPESTLVGKVIVDDGKTVLSEATTKVEEDGSFQMDLDHHIYVDAELVIGFYLERRDDQEDEIFENYGDDGENLEGPFVYRYSGQNWQKAEVVIPYFAKEENDLTIKAPEWEERPEDYGDGRVWFDHVEVKEDGEYFYVSGKTNLVEGAHLRINYFFTRGDTRVLPDGTFEKKFDYEYHEGKEMVIEFEPGKNSTQWNHVQDVYGKDGSELVGDLVEPSGYKDYQMIVYPIDWSEEE